MTEIIVEKLGTTLKLTLNRPEKLNAITYDMHDMLVDAVDRADGDDGIRAVVVTGAGRAFCAGTDLSAGGFARLSGEVAPRPPEGTIPRDKGGKIALRIFESRKPFIAAVNGFAAGMGAGLSLAMDMRIGCTNTRYAFPYVRRGITPESCSTWFLPRIAGLAKALEWMETGRMIEAEELVQASVLNALVEPERLVDHAMQLAEEIARHGSPVAVSLTRQILFQAMICDHPMEAHRLESQALVRMAETGDPKEGARAFTEKRAPIFPGRPSAHLGHGLPAWNNPPYE